MNHTSDVCHCVRKQIGPYTSIASEGKHSWVEVSRDYQRFTIKYRCTNGDRSTWGPCPAVRYVPFTPAGTTPQSVMMDEYIDSLPKTEDGRLDMNCPACREVVDEARAKLAALRAACGVKETP